MSPLARIAHAYTPRFAEFAFEPGFTAAVDQHVAELRDRLSPAGPGGALAPAAPDPAGLADYALGFLDGLAELDWREPAGHDFAVCRLTAITWLVHRHGLLGPPADGPHER
ncbi:DUF6401 family natural product biosynthesis protein [Streptomyces sp. MJP52]|uniref:DUF6401 family natural product biosynthesis protein n=1 Tax=Streptomyces sp. MJP52 TaxID=2940555 RepID=UPI0024745272|nr:DUF6401 family natural product biosynthesis protein [Streptomyces sp. MJP52]MDH6225932.1 hypothetical protein [Streptomyces sp. MJP52]